MPRIAQQKDRTLTPRAFETLLRWLDGGSDSGGQKYLEMRERLAAYFDRKNCPAPDDLADETLSRVARRLDEEGQTDGADPPAKYCYIVARFVFMEHLRRARQETAQLDEAPRRSEERGLLAPGSADEQELKEKMLDCLEQCVDQLPDASRDIIRRYYVGQERIKIENRRALAAELGITQNALSIRACRIRDKLEACVRECAGQR